MIIRGSRSTGIHAKNYIGHEADKRLQEVINPIKQQGLNALNVDWDPVELFQNCPSNVTCTCREVQVTKQHQEASVDKSPVIARNDLEIKIDWKRPSFGTANETPQVDDEFDESELNLRDDDDTENEDAIGTTSHTFTTTADCGICMRTGVVPGYTAYNRQRTVLCTHHVEQIEGFQMLSHLAPNAFERYDQNGFVEFELQVPKIYKNVRVGVWNNREYLGTDEVYFADGNPIAQAGMKANAGKLVGIRVRAEKFTHVVFDFHLGLEMVHANIAQFSKSTDWTQVDTLGQLNVVLPMTINKVSNGDVIYVPGRKQAFKVTDVPYLQTARNDKLDWAVQVRVLQPSEVLHNLRKGGLLS